MDEGEKSSDLIQWSEEFLIRNEMVDFQHKMLVERFNKLVRCSHSEATRKDTNFIGFLMDDLLSYVVYHFSSEQLLMEKTNYSDVDNHTEIHTRFIEYIRKSMKDLEAGKDIIDEFTSSLKVWTEKHILGNDKAKLGPHLEQYNQDVLSEHMRYLENDLRPSFRQRRVSFLDGITESLRGVIGIRRQIENTQPILEKYRIPLIISLPSICVIIFAILISFISGIFWFLLLPYLPLIFILVLIISSIIICSVSLYIRKYVLSIFRSIREVIDRIATMDDLSPKRSEISRLGEITGESSLPRSFNQLLLSMDNYSKYVPLDFLQSVVRRNEKVSVGLESRYVTVFFNDIQNFTTICEDISPSDLVKFLQFFYDINDTAVWELEGNIITQTGDGIMAIWNSPKWCLEHEEKAIRCALLIQKNLRESFQTSVFFDDPLIVRFGINSSSCLVGNVGSEHRLSYNVFGDAVNLSSRLEGVNKFYETRILISTATYMGVTNKDRFQFRWIDNVRVKGKDNSVSIFEVLGCNEKLIPEEHEKIKVLKPIGLIVEEEEEEIEGEFDDEDDYLAIPKLNWRCKFCGHEQKSRTPPHQCEKCGMISKEKNGVDVWFLEEEEEEEETTYEDILKKREEKKVEEREKKEISILSFSLKKAFEDDNVEEAKEICSKILKIRESDLPTQILLRRILKEDRCEPVSFQKK